MGVRSAAWGRGGGGDAICRFGTGAQRRGRGRGDQRRVGGGAPAERAKRGEHVTRPRDVIFARPTQAREPKPRRRRTRCACAGGAAARGRFLPTRLPLLGLFVSSRPSSSLAEWPCAARYDYDTMPLLQVYDYDYERATAPRDRPRVTDWPRRFDVDGDVNEMTTTPHPDLGSFFTQTQRNLTG